MIFQGRTEELLQKLSAQMELAASQLNFEKAAQVRDQINAIQGLGIDQKVTLPDDTISRDAIALAGDNNYTCIQLFQIRAGRLVGRLGFFADTVSGKAEGILQRVLEEHYLQVDAVEIPSEILVQYPLPETDILANWLGEAAKSGVNSFSRT